jgi:hypothetical protein
MNKAELVQRGAQLMVSFCATNSLPAPTIREAAPAAWGHGVCAFYRPSYVAICVPRCAAIGTAGRQWSYPGYTVDRTPYGVLQHELGHHVDVLRSTRRGNYYGDFGLRLRQVSGERQITSYCPDDAEWFAEMFRVFVTNPDLLRIVRPRTYREIRSCFTPVFEDTWRDRLRDAPARTIAAAARHVEAAAGSLL